MCNWHESIDCCYVRDLLSLLIAIIRAADGLDYCRNLCICDDILIYKYSKYAIFYY